MQCIHIVFTHGSPGCQQDLRKKCRKYLRAGSPDFAGDQAIKGLLEPMAALTGAGEHPSIVR
jgi:hypothetical protein